MALSTLDKKRSLKILKTVGYVAASAVIGYLLTLITKQPELFGVFTPLVNVVLVALKQLFTTPEE